MICQPSVYKNYWRFDRLKNVKISNNSVSIKKFSGKFQKNFVGRQNCRINGSIFNMYRTTTCLNRIIL